MFTSSQVLNVSHAYEEFLPYNIEVVFLDEFRMMIYIPQRTGNPPEFTLFNTFISQDYPTNFRRFRVPLKYRDCYPSVTLDNCICLGMLNQDEPLTVDPTQAFILLELSSIDSSTDAVITLRIQVLIEQACLMDTGTHIPWRELTRDAVVVETSVSDSNFYVQGVHVIEEPRNYFFFGDGSLMHFRTFNFSKRGCSTFQDADGETVRYFSLEWGGTVPHPLGNGTFYCLVCGFRRSKAHEG